MDDASARNQRLAPLVSFAYSIQQGVVPTLEPPPSEPTQKPASQKDCLHDTYVDGLREEIEQKYTFPKHGFSILCEKALSGKIGHYTEEDCADAVRVLNEFLVAGLFIESRYGDSEQAVEEFKKEVPGLHDRMYSRYLGLLSWVNR